MMIYHVYAERMGIVYAKRRPRSRTTMPIPGLVHQEAVYLCSDEAFTSAGELAWNMWTVTVTMLDLCT